MHTNTKKQRKHKFSHSFTTHFEMYIFLFFYQCSHTEQLNRLCAQTCKNTEMVFCDSRLSFSLAFNSSLGHMVLPTMTTLIQSFSLRISKPSPLVSCSHLFVPWFLFLPLHSLLKAEEERPEASYNSHPS